jgi:hypothetical protein
VLLEQVDARFAKAMNETVRSVATTISPARELIAFALALVAALAAWGVSGFGQRAPAVVLYGGALGVAIALLYQWAARPLSANNMAHRGEPPGVSAALPVTPP